MVWLNPGQEQGLNAKFVLAVQVAGVQLNAGAKKVVCRYERKHETK